jgi:hypothetical protein
MKVLSPSNKHDLALSYFFLIFLSAFSHFIPAHYDIVLTLFLLLSFYFSSLGWDRIRNRHNMYACELANSTPVMQLLGVPLLLVYTYSCMTFMAFNEVGTVTVSVCLVTHCLGYFVDNDSLTTTHTLMVFFLAPFFIITLNLFVSALKSTRFVAKIDYQDTFH